MTGTHVLVMAKAPVPGRVKTRLCPPCSPEQSAALAEAALADTLAAVAGCGASRRIVALEGAPGPWLPPGFRVIRQSRGSFSQRLAHAWSVAGGPGVQIGMDTPQLAPADLDSALGALDTAPAALGHAIDGGWWAIALRRPDPRLFHGVAMSTDHTGRDQEAQLVAFGLEITLLPTMVDLDTVADLAAIAAHGGAVRTVHLARRLGLLPAPVADASLVSTPA